MKEIFKSRHFFFISHRGNSGEYPQNTIESFRSALAVNPDTCFEYDLRWTKDKHVVVVHDPDVDATTDGFGLVKDYTLAELVKLDAGFYFTKDNGLHYPYRGQGVKIALFQDILNQFPNTPVLLHIKIDSILFIQSVVKIIREQSAENRVIIGSFQQKNINWVRKHAPEIATSFTRSEIIKFIIFNMLGLARFFHCKGDVFSISEYSNSERPEYKKGDFLQGIRVVTKRFIRNAHKLGYKVFVWTVNDKNNMKRLIDMDIDGILTDVPKKLLNVINNR